MLNNLGSTYRNHLSPSRLLQHFTKSKDMPQTASRGAMTSTAAKSAGSSTDSNAIYGDYVVYRSPSDNEIVYLEYDPSNLPPPPSDSYTRFVCISDTHARSFPVPDGDVLLHTGDLTNLGFVEEFKKMMEWIYGMPHKVKIMIAGNHDLPLHSEWFKGNFPSWRRPKHHDVEKEYENIIELLKGPKAKKANLVYLQNEEYSFRAKKDGRTWSVYGSPWSPEFGGWAFGYEPEDAPPIISKFPKTDILLTHGPPYDILDRTTRGDKPGCPTLLDALQTGQVRPRLHVFGHIHEAHGAHIHSWSTGNVIGSVQNSPDEGVDENAANSGNSPAIQPGEQTDNQGQGDMDTEEGTDTGVTAFVNAAAWPMGLRRSNYQDIGPPQFGGPGFRPVVVDLRD
ncbi:hypothetical protein GYMLUDRAFT_50930 [Collybiopsis luxurians FD-317 M1]|uniref:Calcineurin-like phosphoesterase domain-containing protein n=1 Tax=Collybiopsis luxurians FD-317 M1 TaxID=944289 RepID=A0A0D0AKX6_9AGAR|nr:hypothetical protein GYMLUDRAFT_50930 [Collybiopsis luxurians FD-317 M1]